MLNTVSQNSIDDQTPSYKWDDEKIISYYKRKAREICSQLEKEDEYKKKGLLNYVPRQFKPKLDFKFQKSKTISSENKKVSKRNKLFTTKQETESVLNMLFPYVKEDHFKIEEFKTGSDLLRETRFKPNITIIKLNQEKRIKSNFNKKFKKYDKELNTFRDKPSIRCSSAYVTEQEQKRKDDIESKKFWMCPEDFKRVFGKRTLNKKDKEEQNRSNKLYPKNDVYTTSVLGYQFRELDKSKWVCKKNFVV